MNFTKQPEPAKKRPNMTKPAKTALKAPGAALEAARTALKTLGAAPEGSRTGRKPARTEREAGRTGQNWADNGQI